MRMTIGLWVVGLVCGAMLGVCGCASSSKSASASDATSPQDKARQEQLSEMSREDAESATLRKLDKPRPRDQNRRTGQRVVDQPVRR